MERFGVAPTEHEHRSRLTLSKALALVARIITPPDVSYTIELLEGGAVHLVGTKIVKGYALQSDRGISALVHGGDPQGLIDAAGEIAADLGRKHVLYLNRRTPMIEVGRIDTGVGARIAAG